MDASSHSLLFVKALDLAVLVLSGCIVTAAAFTTWYWAQHAEDRRIRQNTLAHRSSRLALLRAELETIVSFAEKCEMANAALDQLSAYQQWLVANALLSWKQNRQMVQSWQQTTGMALQIRMGTVPVKSEVVEQLVSDMRRTEFPAPEDDHFRWEQTDRVKQIVEAG